VKLKEYQRKRDFTQTREPAGKPAKSKGALKFFVQKHAATRLHYDLRLEMGGVLKSWAVPRGPSMNPLDQRLAVHVEDHPLEYGSFEGIIPKGNYGAGTVMVWDRGTYVARSTSARGPGEKAMLKGYAEGKITFVLSGEKLKGEFALVRLKGKDPKAWILVKKRDSFATFGESLWEEVSAISKRPMKKIAEESAKKKDIWLPKHGKAEAVPRRLRPMQARITLGFTPSAEWVYEPYYKGVRVLAEIENGQVRLYSGGLLTLNKKYPAIVDALEGIPYGTVLDGEIVGKKLILYDLLYSQGKDLRASPLLERKKILKGLKIFGPTLVYGEHESDPKKVQPASGRLVAKKKDSVYTTGLSRDWARLPLSAFSKSDADDKPPLRNLDKVFWPDEGITKGDLLRYYDKIAPVLLPHLKDRPESLHRQPDGLKNEGFFQKDNAGFLPRRVETARVYSGSSEKTINYVLCQDRWTLLYLVNLGCIELNPWISRKPTLENPDYVVIDLDPDDNSFDEVVEVALEVNRVLKKIGVKAWCKTSGASGLHICIPLSPGHTYEEARLFAEDVCKVVREKFKRNTSLERTPAKRRGKIYLDYLQNRRGQTLAAPYCVRPRPGATVSTPLKWAEVKPGLDPTAFTIETIGDRVKRYGDLWAPTLRGTEKLAPARKRLSKFLHNL